MTYKVIAIREANRSSKTTRSSTPVPAGQERQKLIVVHDDYFVLVPLGLHDNQAWFAHGLGLLDDALFAVQPGQPKGQGLGSPEHDRGIALGLGYKFFGLDVTVLADALVRPGRQGTLGPGVPSCSEVLL